MGKQYYNGNNYSNFSDEDKEYSEKKEKKEKDYDQFENDELDCDDFNCFKNHCMECHEKRNINKEIKETFNAIINELCDINKDIEKLNKLFCKLEKLLAEKGCLSSKEKALICNIRKDIQALNCVLKETAKDIKCLQEMVL